MKLAGGLTFCTLILGISLTSWAQSSATEPIEHAHFAGYTDPAAIFERDWEIYEQMSRIRTNALAMDGLFGNGNGHGQDNGHNGNGHP